MPGWSDEGGEKSQPSFGAGTSTDGTRRLSYGEEQTATAGACALPIVSVVIPVVIPVVFVFEERVIAGRSPTVWAGGFRGPVLIAGSRVSAIITLPETFIPGTISVGHLVPPFMETREL